MSSSSQRLPQSSQQPATKPAKNTKVACKSCHKRRVKCDAGESQPCWHCRMRGSQCELIESRRGKYPRRKPTALKSTNATAYTPESISPDNGNPTCQTLLDTTYSRNSTSLGQAPSPPTTAGPNGNGRSEGPEMLYARLAESNSNQASLNSFPDNVRSFYMGESFSLSFVVRSLSSNAANRSGPKLHYPIPNTVSEHANNAAERLKDTDTPTLTYLNMHGAFILPSQDISDELIRIFFTSFHPAYPVFDRREFFALYQQNQVPLIVLQTIYFLSFTICGEDLLRRAGFVDRYSARRTSYLRAKALYDMDCEKNKVKLTSVLFLLGFWWEGPEDQKDTWHWLGAAISLAQTLGMHRSTANSGMSLRHQSLWKRLWWSIYVRDRHAAASLGRPCRIRDEDCDVEMIKKEDFLVDREYDSGLLGTEHEYHSSYAIEMAKLAIIRELKNGGHRNPHNCGVSAYPNVITVGKILCRECAPGLSSMPVSSEDLNQSLQDWELNLPSCLRRQPVNELLEAPFWSCMLYACYHHCQILLCRLKQPAAIPNINNLPHKNARIAADCMTRIAEDLLAAGTLIMGQLHLVPGLFAALSIHALAIRGNEGVQKQLAENRARQCILAMGELAKGWPVAGWILRLFINLMNRVTGQSGSLESNLSPPMEIHTEHSFQNNQRPTQNMENPLSYMSIEGESICHDEDQTDQLVSDLIWVPDQSDFDFDPMFRNTQLNGVFPYNLG